MKPFHGKPPAARPSPARSQKHGEAGSILMETILVLPLLLMLLGGMFLLGDLALGRLVTQDAGRYEAWSTCAKVELPESADVFKFAETERFFGFEKFYSTGTDFSENKRATGNSWGWGRMGYAVSKSELPLWSAWVNVQHDVMSQNGDRMESEFELHGEDSIFAPSFDYHRIAPEIAESVDYDMEIYNRGAEAAEVEETVIAMDAHFAIEDEARGDAHGGRTPYARNPLLAGLAE